MSTDGTHNYILAARQRTVSGSFSDFLDRQINIAVGTRSSASGSQEHLRDFLSNVCEEDAGFPFVLGKADVDFLGGSWARQTKIWPLNDIDVYLPLDGFGLVYTQGGVTQDVVVLTDNLTTENPLMTDPDRWVDGLSISSRKLIDGFAKVLRRHYPTTTRVRRVGEAVSVTLANDLGFDVVPCFSIRPRPAHLQHFYLIPDGADGWIRSNPRLDTEMSQYLHAANKKTLRKAVKLFKWWSNAFIGGRIESYYSELAIMREFQNQNNMGRTIETVPEAVEVAFSAVWSAASTGAKEPLLDGAPKVEPGDVTSADLSSLFNGLGWCRIANQREQEGKVADALAAWKRVFGNSFPTE